MTTATPAAHGSSISRTIEIEGMTGDECVTKVTSTLKGVPHIATKFVKVGSAVIGADQAGCKAACAALCTAGFKSHEDTRSHAERQESNGTNQPNGSASSAQNTHNTQSSQPRRDGVANDRPGSNSQSPTASPPVERNRSGPIAGPAAGTEPAAAHPPLGSADRAPKPAEAARTA